MDEGNPRARVPGWLERLRRSRSAVASESDATEGSRSPRIAVVTDSGSSLPPEFVSAHADVLTVVHMPVMIDGQIYAQDPANIDRELALALALGKPVKTSRPAPGQFSEVYTALAERGFHGVVSIHISGELSGTADAARLAAQDGPIPVEVIDSRTAGLAQGFLVMDTVEFLETEDDDAAQVASSSSEVSGPVNGADPASEAEETLEHSATEVADPVEQVFQKIRTLCTTAVPTIDFAVPSLDQLRAGGRISVAASVLGSLLSVKPILHLVDGKLQVLERVRTTPKVFARLLELAIQEAERSDVPVRFGVQSFGSEELARQLARDLESHTTYPVIITSVTTVLAAHTGAGVLAICCAPER